MGRRKEINIKKDGPEGKEEAALGKGPVCVCVCFGGCWETKTKKVACSIPRR